MTTLDRKSLHLAEISFLLSVIFSANSLVLICEQFLLSYTATLFVTFCILTSCFHVILNHLKLQSAKSLYRSALLLNATHFMMCSDSKQWNMKRGSLMVFIGFLIVCLYVVYVWFSSCCTPVRDGVEETVLAREEEEAPTPPLAVELSFVFIGNGVALIGRLYLPDHGFRWSFVGGGIMFCVSVLFFCGFLCLFSRTRYDNTQVHTD